MRRTLNISHAAVTALLLTTAALFPAPTATAGDAARGGQPAATPAPTRHEPSPQLPALFRDELAMPDTLGVGRVARDVREHLPELQAMADYLSEKLAGDGAARCRPVIARNNAEMIDLLRRGIVDVVSETPISAMRFIEEAGAEILLRERRDGVAEYRSVIFVRADSAITRLADLRGKRVAFEDRGSTSAFLLPLATMKAAGLATVELSDGRAAAIPDAVGYFFAVSERPLSETVRSGLAEAGAFSDLDWAKLLRRDPAAAAGLRIVAETEIVPRGFLLTGPSVTPALRQALKNTLLAMHEHDAGRSVLEEYDKVERYDDIDAALRSRIERMHELYQLVHDEVGRSDAAPVEVN